MTTRRRPARCVALLCGALLLAGCASHAGPENAATAAVEGPGPAASPQALGAQACTERMHELCQWLLLYYAQHRELPASLDALSNIAPGITADAYRCPTTGETYRYNPQGWATDGGAALVIVKDHAPVHLGAGLAILMPPPRPGQALVLRVASRAATDPAYTGE